MLNQLIESKNNYRENKRKGGFILTTLAVLASVLMGSWTYSLFAKDYAFAGGSLELSDLVAPVAVAEEPAPRPEPENKSAPAAKSNKIILKDLYDTVESSKTPPKNLIGQKEIVSARPYEIKDIQIGDRNVIPSAAARGNTTVSGTGCGLCGGKTTAVTDDDEKAPVVVKPTPQTPAVKPPPQSGGVLNGKASYLAKPPYPAPAKAVRAEGAVNVQVLIDETGSVVSATAVSGHPLLRTAAVDAARKSRFTPTYLSKQPVKVTGFIVYNFKAQ
jgi:TonB family protein